MTNISFILTTDKGHTESKRGTVAAPKSDFFRKKPIALHFLGTFVQGERRAKFTWTMPSRSQRCMHMNEFAQTPSK